MKRKYIKNIKKRLKKERIDPAKVGFDKSEYELELQTQEEDDDWDKKVMEDEEREYDEGNWHERDYE